jgi:hypothetical protein
MPAGMGLGETVQQQDWRATPTLGNEVVRLPYRAVTFLEARQ